MRGRINILVIDSARTSRKGHESLASAMHNGEARFVSRLRGMGALPSVQTLAGGVRGSDLQHGAVRSFADGADMVIFLGGHFQSIDEEVLEIAATALARPLTLVIGPVRTGGIYLLGLNDLFPDLFDGAVLEQAWSGDSEAVQALTQVGSGIAEQIVLLPGLPEK